VSRRETNARLRDPIPVRSTSSRFLNTLLLFLLVLLDCTPPFPLFLSSPFLFDYLPSAYLFSAQLWNISGIIIFSFVITLVSRSNFLWSPSPRTQQNHKKRSISTSPHLWPSRFPLQGLYLHQNQPLTCVPFGPYCQRRRMENRLPYSLWSLRMVSNAVWTN